MIHSNVLAALMYSTNAVAAAAQSPEQFLLRTNASVNNRGELPEPRGAEEILISAAPAPPRNFVMVWSRSE
jgi:hypothetical protein